jgi:fusion and transport protein UGO1
MTVDASYTVVAAPPQEEWLFLPPTVSPSKVPASSGSDRMNGGGGGGYSSSSKDSSRFSADITTDDLDDDDPFSLYGLGSLFAAEYLTTALGMPFEVGKTLLQLEYKPKEGIVTEDVANMPEEDDGKTGREWRVDDDVVSR